MEGKDWSKLQLADGGKGLVQATIVYRQSVEGVVILE